MLLPSCYLRPVPHGLSSSVHSFCMLDGTLGYRADAVPTENNAYVSLHPEYCMISRQNKPFGIYLKLLRVCILLISVCVHEHVHTWFGVHVEVSG